MKNLNEHCVTSETTELSEELKSMSVIHVEDHMPIPAESRISIRGEPHYFKNSIIDLFDRAGLDYRERTFVFDVYLTFEDFPKAVFTGEAFHGTAKKFIQYNRSWTAIPKDLITQNFSFIISRARAHRKFLAAVVKNLIPHADYNYTMVYSDGYPVDELLIDTDYDIDVNNTLPLKEVAIPFDNRQRSGLLNFRTLYDSVFAGSPVALITEPMFFERGAGITEKLFMAVYSGQFMIWPGTYKGAETVAKYGIDVFDNIVDHSYQYIDHPGKRVVEAIKRNYRLLTDLEYVTALREQHFTRLENNFKYLQSPDKILEVILSHNPPEWHDYIIKTCNTPR